MTLSGYPVWLEKTKTIAELRTDLHTLWPETLLTWYHSEKRDLPWRRTQDPYWIWISEVMLQQTQVKTVIPYYQAFIERFPDPVALASASLDEVLERWRGLGYYSRAKNLWRGASFLVENYGGVLPRSYAELIRIPGVGEYTAGAVSSIAFGERVPAIDGNVKRVLARLYAWEHDINSAASKRFMLNVLWDCLPEASPGDFNQAMMELGASLCKPRSPQCPSCPLRQVCQAYRQSDPCLYPVKRSKVKVSEAIRPTLVIVHNGRVLLKRRPEDGLLANLWEFPGEEILLKGWQEKIPADLALPNWAHRDKEADCPEPERRQHFRAAEIPAVYETNKSELLPRHHMIDDRDRLTEENAWNPVYWLALYQTQTQDRSCDSTVQSILESGIKLNGPLLHVFSHRRWHIVWILLDLDDIETGRTGCREDEADPADRMPIGETHSYHWATAQEMEQIALPTAFQKVWAEVLNSRLDESRCLKPNRPVNYI